jgi:C4-dicarboxylate-specific signal transduction histidine kinase
VAFLTVTLVTLGLVVGLNEHAARRALTDAAYRSLFAAAKHTAARLDAFVVQTETVLGAEAKQPQLRAYLAPPRRAAARDLREERRALRTLESFIEKDRAFIASYALLDLSGRDVLDTQTPRVGREESDAECFRGALETNLPYTAPLRFSRLDGKPYLWFCSPVHDARGDVVGVLRLLYSAAILGQHIVSASDLPGPPSFAILLDQDGLVLAQGASSPASAADLLYRFVTTPSPQRVEELAAERGLPPGIGVAVLDLEGFAEGIAKVDSPDPYFISQPIGEARGRQAAAVARMESRPWIVAYLRAEEGFLAPIAEHTRGMLLVALAIGGAVAAGAIGIAHLLAKPIAGLTAFVQRVTAGDLRAQATVTAGGEMGTLIDAFNLMTVRLRAREEELARMNAELEQRVEQRTRELREANDRLVAEMAERERAEAAREALGKQLLETAHRAGMAEIATSVLHNVGNVLNSLNVSAEVLADRLPGLSPRRLRAIATLLREHEDDLGAFMTEDPRGRHVSAYLQAVAQALADEHRGAAAELENIRKDIDHIKAVIAVQHAYARAGSPFTTLVDLRQLLEDALRINQLDLRRRHVEVIRDLDPVPPVLVEKHKVLQILVNLVKNAIVAMAAAPGNPRKLTLRLSRQADTQVRIEVADTGVGIPREDLVRVFQRGYTTAAHGHGLGLHSAALMAAEMSGSLTARSAGRGEGAVFVLELPLAPAAEEKAPPPAPKAAAAPSAPSPPAK